MSEEGAEDSAQTEIELWALASQWDIFLLKDIRKILKD